jgi:hypothetical protein
MNQVDIKIEQVEALFKSAKLSATILSFDSCAKGGNNRTYRVETVDGVFAVKKYFRGPADKRDRLASEFSFLMYAKETAPHFVPKAYAQDIENGLALYEFIEGRSVTASELTEHIMTQPIQFFCLLNDPDAKKNATSLALASEAGFSIEDHLISVNSRIFELQQAIFNETDENAKVLMTSLSQYWDDILQTCRNQAISDGIDVSATLDYSQRCISPSDFGFHNALMLKNQQIKFLDFEYAGWDDPARMVNDFFSQLAVPIPAKYYDWFVREVMKPFPQTEHLIMRAKLLRPIYHIKWCCIALNVFIPVHMARRQFANPQLNVVDLRKTQLAKAELLLKNLEVSHYGSY